MTDKRWELTKEGAEFAENGSAEFRVFALVKDAPVPQADIMVRITSKTNNHQLI